MGTRHRTCLLLVALVAISAGSSIRFSASAQFRDAQLTVRHSDFNGDGFEDLAIPAPKEDVGSLVDAGVVHVLYGTAQGLDATGSQLWTQDSPGIPGVTEGSEKFGESVTPGDFDGDGFDDLAIGVPGEDDERLGTTDSGVVNVIYGSDAGLTAQGAQLFSQDTPDVQENVESFDHFGQGLTAADFNGDGYVDLAVGVWGESVGTVSSAGAVGVLYGSAGGLQANSPDDQLWSQDAPGVLDQAEDYDAFGYRVAEGDFNVDGFPDLAVGVPDEWIGSTKEAGAVNILYGSPLGLASSGNQFWSQDSPGVLGTAELEDLFGLSLAAADFNEDGAADLAVGVPLEDVGRKVDAGAVNVLYGSASGLGSDRNQLWTQGSAGVLDKAEFYDEFGWALVGGDFDGDGYADLAVSADGEVFHGLVGAGATAVLYGSGSGLSSERNQLWSQDRPGILDTAEDSDYFGESMSDGDFNADGAADLAVGVPWEDLGGLTDAGAVNVIYGRIGSGLSAVGNQFWNQDSPGVDEVAEAGDEFGWV